MGEAIKSDAAVSLLIPLLLISGQSFFFFFFWSHYTGRQSALRHGRGFKLFWVLTDQCPCGGSGVQLFLNERVKGYSLISVSASRHPCGSLRYLWVIRTTPGLQHPPSCLPASLWPLSIDGFLLVKGDESSGTIGGETCSWGKQNRSLRTTCHNMFREQAGWLNNWVCGDIWCHWSQWN